MGDQSQPAPADTATQNQILFRGIRLAILMHAQFACAGLPINAPPAPRVMRLWNAFAILTSVVIETLSLPYPAQANGQEDSGRQIPCLGIASACANDQPSWHKVSQLMAEPLYSDKNGVFDIIGERHQKLSANGAVNDGHDRVTRISVCSTGPPSAIVVLPSPPTTKIAA